MTYSGRQADVSHRYWALIALVLLIALWLRLTDLVELPLFLDEAIHIDRARVVLAGRPHIGMQDNKWLHPILLALFQPTGPESPWLARAVSALLGLLSLSACIALGNLSGDKRTGLLAGLIYAVLPFTVFHERQALADPLMVACATISTVLVMRLAYHPRPWMVPLLGMLLAGAYLTKIAALPYLALPLAGVLLLAPRPIRLRSLNGGLAAIALAIIPIWLVYRLAAQQGVTPAPIYQVDLTNLTLAAPDRPDLLSRLASDLPVYLDILVRYLGWIALLLIGIALSRLMIGGKCKPKRRATLYLLIPGLVFVAVPLLADRPAGYLAPRYLLATVPPLIALAGLALTWLERQLAK